MTTTQAPPPRRTARWVMYFIILVLVGIFGLYYTGALQPRPKLALVTANQGPYWDLLIEGAQDAAKRYDANLTVFRSSGDEAQQTSTIRSLFDAGYSGVAISPNNPAMQAGLLTDLGARTSLITFDSDCPVANRICFIGTDNYDAGRLCGQQVRQALPQGGDVLISVGSLEKENGQRRRQGLIDELLERSFEPQRPMDPIDAPLKGSKFNVVATLVDGIDPQRATDLVAQQLEKTPNVKAIAGLFAYSTPAVLRALEKSNKLGQVKVIGFDFNQETLAGLESGTVQVTIVQDAYSIGFETIRILSDLGRGERSRLPMYQVWHLTCDLVTKDGLPMLRQKLHAPTPGGGSAAGPAGAAPATKAATQ